MSKVKKIIRNPVNLWILVFVCLNLFARGVADVPQNSRFMSMRAISSDFSFITDKYFHWSMDWARTPSTNSSQGHYYSNKAPGTIFIGLPIFWILDQINRITAKISGRTFDKYQVPGPAYGIIISLITQIIPICILMLVFVRWMQQKAIPLPAIHFTTLAILFANTTSIFFNSYFGHGMLAVMVLALAYSWVKENYRGIGLAFGFILLSDYGGVLLLPPLILVVILKHQGGVGPTKMLLHLKQLIVGGIIPGLLWIWYHTACFDSPFAIANMFQNPIMQDMGRVKGNLWGIFAPIPNMEIIYHLTLGPIRGILFTQPWLLMVVFVIIWQLWHDKKKRKNGGGDVDDNNFRLLAIFSLSSLFLLLWMNSSFGSWHGGGTAGPRYISLIFPLFALLAGLCYQRLSSSMKKLLWMLLIVTLFFRGLVYATTILSPPNQPLWPWHFNYLLNASSKHWIRMLVFIMAMVISGSYYYHSVSAKTGFKNNNIN